VDGDQAHLRFLESISLYVALQPLLQGPLVDLDDAFQFGIKLKFQLNNFDIFLSHHFLEVHFMLKMVPEVVVSLTLSSLSLQARLISLYFDTKRYQEALHLGALSFLFEKKLEILITAERAEYDYSWHS
jgi:hypothetical protein